MKKTITANISGIVFHIDEDAYEKLSNYLSGVRGHFTSDEGGDEIISDIESRIAEMLQQKITASKKVITIDDVKEVISQLGEPEQIGEAGEHEEKNGKKFTESVKTQKRLYRDPDDKYIAGVSGGIAAFFNIDPTWVRVAFVLFTFLYGFGPVLYLVLWIVVPKASTTAEKLEMRGEKVNISNIEKSIREELNDLKKNIKDFSAETREKIKKKEKRRTDSNELSDFFAAVFRVIARVFGIFLILAALTLMIVFVSSLYWIPISFSTTYGILHFAFPEFLSAFLAPPLFVNIAIAGILLLIGIPIFMIILSGIRLLFGIEGKMKYVGLTAFVFWLVGLSIVIFMSFSALRNFSQQQRVYEEHTLKLSDWPNIYLELDDTQISNYHHRRNNYNLLSWKTNWLDSENTAKGFPRVNIKTSSSDQMTLTVIKESRGFDFIEADDNANNIKYSFQQVDSLIILDPFFYHSKENGWRNQNATLELYVPKDKIVVAGKQLKQNLDLNWSRSVKVTETE